MIGFKVNQFQEIRIPALLVLDIVIYVLKDQMMK